VPRADLSGLLFIVAREPLELGQVYLPQFL